MIGRLGVAVASALVASGCIFGGGSEGVSDAGFDLTQDAAEDSGGADGGQRDSGPDAAVVDLGDPDMTLPPDVAVPDMPPPPPDMGEPDMPPPVDMPPPPPAPFEVLQQIPIVLGGQPSADAPVQVATFDHGFLVGHRGDTNFAQFGWYADNSSIVLHTSSYPASGAVVDIAGEGPLAFATFHSDSTLHGAAFQARRPMGAAPTFDHENFDQNTNGAYLTTSIGFEKGTAYTLSIRRYTSQGGLLVTDAELGTVGMGGLGFTTPPVEDLDLTEVDTIGGRKSATGRRVISAGVAGGEYLLVESDYPGGDYWVHAVAGCGTAPADGRRVTPVGGEWVLALRPVAGGGRSWQAVRCVEPIVAITLANVGSGTVTDFDTAEEDFSGLEFGVAWVEGGDVWVGRVSLDPVAQMGILIDQWKLPGMTGQKVRMAYNPQRDQWGVAVTRANDAEIIILGRGAMP